MIIGVPLTRSLPQGRCEAPIGRNNNSRDKVHNVRGDSSVISRCSLATSAEASSQSSSSSSRNRRFYRVTPRLGERWPDLLGFARQVPSPVAAVPRRRRALHLLFVHATAAPAGFAQRAPPPTLMTFPVNVSGWWTCPDSSCSCRTASCWPGHSTRIGSKFTGDARQVVDGIPVTGPDARRSLHPGLAFWRFRPTRWEPRPCCGGSRGMVTSPRRSLRQPRLWVLLVPG